MWKPLWSEKIREVLLNTPLHVNTQVELHNDGWLGVSSMSDDKDPEDAVREYLDGFLKWFGGGGFSRHVGMTMLILGMSAPFILGVSAIIVVWFWVAPAASNFTERLAVFGVLFGLLTAIGLQVASVSQRMVFGLYLLRRRRKRKASEEGSSVV